MKKPKNKTLIFFLVSTIIVCIVALGIFFAVGTWLNTYKVFTQKTAVAEMTITEIRQDELGPYVEVELTEFDLDSGLEASLFGIKQTAESELESSTKTYKLYGDEIYIGGPVIKLKNTFLLANANNVYRIGRLSASYTDSELEAKRDNSTMPNRYELNSGYSEWRRVNQTYESNSALGVLYRTLIESINIQTPGIFVPERESTYIVYATFQGFSIEQK